MQAKEQVKRLSLRIIECLRKEIFDMSYENCQNLESKRYIYGSIFYTYW